MGNVLQLTKTTRSTDEKGKALRRTVLDRQDAFYSDRENKTNAESHAVNGTHR